MPRFIKDTDYTGRIKTELKALISGSTNDQPTQALLQAEDSAIATIKEYIGSRYDCALIFTASLPNVESRNLHIVEIVLAIAMFRLYMQTPAKDMPEHRKMAYDDAISWLKDVGRGSVSSGSLPALSEEDGKGEIRFNSRKPINQKW